MIEHSDTQSFTNPQKKRIKKFLVWRDEADKNGIVIKALEFSRDFNFNFYATFYQKGSEGDANLSEVYHLKIDRLGTQYNVGDDYKGSTSGQTALYRKFDSFRKLTRVEINSLCKD